VYARRGIPPSVAVSDSTAPRPDLLLVAQDSIAVLAEHPSHPHLFRYVGLAGTAQPTRLTVDASTKLHMPLVDGVPRAPRWTASTPRARSCSRTSAGPAAGTD
jgi:hypothetical protein